MTELGLVWYVLIFGVPFVLFIGLPLALRSDWKVYQRITAPILIWLISGFVIGGGFYLERTGYNDSWNDGECSECQVEWELFDIEKGKNFTYYYYKCPECKNIIEQDISH